MQSETKQCQNCKKDFVIEPEDFAFYEKIKVPPPTFCPLCRFQRRMSWRNERYLFKRKDNHSGQEIFSVFAPDEDLVVYDQEYWRSDAWDQFAAGRDYDFSKPFFEQLKELLKTAPVPSRTVFSLINSDYTNQGGNLKDCYLVFGSLYMENSAYVDNSNRSKDCFESSFIVESELVYGNFFAQRCYHSIYSLFCEDSHDIIFCRDCIGCSNCIGCVNLRNKSYCIFNEQYTKEEYQKKFLEFNIGSRKSINELAKLVKEYQIKNPVRFVRGRHNVQSSGEYLINCKNVKQSYYVNYGENLKYCQFIYGKGGKDSYDWSRLGENTELVYESGTAGSNSSRIKFSESCNEGASDIFYSYRCPGSSYLFGCVALHSAQYCILNKQYTKEEYEKLVPKIIEHMNAMPYTDKGGRVYRYGEFFPIELSPFRYNTTVAQEFFPITEQIAREKNYKWKEDERKNYNVTLQPDKLPDNIKDVSDSILKEVIACADKGKNLINCPGVFRITRQELDFYRRMQIPLPQLCPNCRFLERLENRSPLNLWHRKCMCDKTNHGHDGKCSNEFETSYSPDRLEIVYCEQCYQQEVA